MGVTGNVLVGDAAVTITTAAGHSGGLQEAGVATIATFYTVDGVNLTVRSSFANIKVEEVVGTIIRKLTDQEVDVTFTFAEGTLANLVAAIAGSSINVAGTIVTLGGGYTVDPTDPILQWFAMQIVGKDPAGLARTIVLPHVEPTGEVGVPYKKGGVSVIPVTFSCIVADTGIFGTITDT
uniref:Uncharacterized protein n=1 Tax=viral metagenome TaxID=1070528 RepID=A0A6M3IXP4_9ZZZZ